MGIKCTLTKQADMIWGPLGWSSRSYPLIYDKSLTQESLLEEFQVRTISLALFHIIGVTIRAPIFGRNQNSALQNITEKALEVYYLDERFVITLSVAGLLHPAILS